MLAPPAYALPQESEVQRSKICDKLHESMTEDSAKDTEHKAYSKRMAVIVATVSVLALTGAAAVLGDRARPSGGRSRR